MEALGLKNKLKSKEGECPPPPSNAGTENCDGLLGYENEPIGTGLIGYYFDNENF